MEYYERHARLGAAFLSELGQAMSRVAEQPVAYQVLYRGVRRAAMRRFPFGVFFLAGSDEAVVVAILHLARNPDAWSSRLGET